MITEDTARQIALAYREVEVAEKLLAEINEPGDNGHRLFNVPWNLARPVIEAHIAQQKAIVAALSEKARIELNGVTS